jgi:GTPase SAR1 family protein
MKIIFIGLANTGKSSIIERYMNNSFKTEYFKVK